MLALNWEQAMKYESVNLLLKQDKYAKITGLFAILVMGYAIYYSSTALVKSIEASQPKAIYEMETGNVTVKGEIYSGKSWVLNKCSEPAGYCWDPIHSHQ